MKAHERLEDFEARSVGLPVPEYISQRGRRKFPSWNEYKDIRTNSNSKGKKRRRSIKYVKVGPKSKLAEY